MASTVLWNYLTFCAPSLTKNYVTLTEESFTLGKKIFTNQCNIAWCSVQFSLFLDGRETIKHKLAQPISWLMSLGNFLSVYVNDLFLNFISYILIAY